MRKSNLPLKRNMKSIISIFMAFISLCGALYLLFPHLENFPTKCISVILNSNNFQIRKLDILGATPKVRKLIQKSLNITKGDSIFKLSTQEIYDKVTSVPWVKSATIRKLLPNVVKIEIQEVIPIAIFQRGNESILIDETGKLIERVTSNLKSLPLVSGENSNTQVWSILEEIKKHPETQSRLQSLSFIRQRRWDITISGIKVKLPENATEKALDVLEIILKSGKINKNTVKSIDLRIPNDVIINGLVIRNKLGV